MRPRRVAVLGAGMAGMAAAWRLSEPGWRDRFDTITVYQRGHRLGGKGASSRGVHDRVEEHGLHVWLGYYDNAFRLMRECYDELDRATTDPGAPIRTIDEAFLPADEVGLEDHHGGAWHHWISTIGRNDLQPGVDGNDGTVTPLDVVGRATALIRDFLVSVSIGPSVHLGTRPEPDSVGPALGPVVGTALVPMAIELIDSLGPAGGLPTVPELDRVLTAVRDDLRTTVSQDHAARRLWQLMGLVLAAARGVLTDERVLDEHGLRELDRYDYETWLADHGASPEVLSSPMQRGLMDLVFGYRGGDVDHSGFGAGLGVFLTYRTFLDYKGSIFWKMAAGMGDIVFAPLYEALRARGVEFAFFHRVDQLHVSDDGHRIGAITLGRQVSLAPGVERYEPLRRFGGLPCFPAEPVVEQLAADGSIVEHDLESHWCEWPDAEEVVLRDGVDFDAVVFAIPPAMARFCCRELIDTDPAWAAMVDGLGTVATQAFQLWLRPTEAELGWDHSGSTVSAYVTPFDTWASMPQLIEPEGWPDDDRPGTIAYFCSVLDGPPPTLDTPPAYAAAERARVRGHAVAFLERHIGHLLPGTVGADGFRWELVCGSAAGDESAFDSQYWRANVDPSDRYVQSLPGTDHLRLRPDESGLDNLFLAGDWTDCGLNAGCIEAATLSGLLAANALEGRARFHRILGPYLP